MKQKGYTLIELIGVIVLLGVLIIIIAPSVDKAIKKGKIEADKQLTENIIMAAKNWASDNKSILPDEPGVKKNVWLTDLQKAGYIEKNIKLPSTGDDYNEACVEIVNKTLNLLQKPVYNYAYNPNCTINLDLVIVGTISGQTNIIPSGTWVNKDIILKAKSTHSGTYQWYKGNTAIGGETKKSYIATQANNTEGKLTYKVKMDAEKQNPEATYVAAIDKKSPAISITSKIATKNNLTISLSESSSGSGLAGYAVTTTKNVPTSWTALSGTSYSTTQTKVTGTYYIHVKDKAGNTTYKTVSIIAMDPPKCRIGLNGTVGTNSWYRSNVAVTMTTTGTVTSKGLATTKNSKNGLTTVTHSTDTGSVTYYGYVSNVAGSGTCSKNFKIDKTAPSISIVTKIATKNNLTISLSESSGGSGLAGYAVTTTKNVPTSWAALSGTSYSTTQTKTTGTYYIHVKDKAGNTTYKSATVTALIPPTCKLSIKGTKGNNSWYRSNVAVTMTTSGTVTSKGLATTKNSKNGETTVTHSGDTGGVTYHGNVANAAGSNSCSISFKKDSTKPTLGYDLRRIYYGSDVGPAYNNHWTNNEIQRKLYPQDNVSGIDHTEYQSGGVWYNEGNVASWIMGNTVSDAYYRTIDKAGNISDNLRLIMKSDWTPPYITHEFRYSDKLGTCYANDSLSGVSSWHQAGTYYYVWVGRGCSYHGPHNIDVHDWGYWWFNFTFHCGSGSKVNFKCNGACDAAGNCGGVATSADYSW